MFIKVNEVVKTQSTTKESNINFNDVSKHHTFQIGYKADSNSQYFNGWIRDMRLYYIAFDWYYKK